MKIRDIYSRDERAVSQVIAVVLMVAITTVLAAVTGTFALGIDDETRSIAPRSTYSFEFTDSESVGKDELVIEQNSGDTVSVARLSVTSSPGGIAESAGGTTSTVQRWGDIDPASADSKVMTGDAATVYAGSGNDHLDDDTVRLVWQSEGGDSTATLARWVGPEA